MDSNKSKDFDDLLYINLNDNQGYPQQLNGQIEKLN